MRNRTLELIKTKLGRIPPKNVLAEALTFHHQTLLLQLVAGTQPGEALGQEFQLLKHLLLLQSP